MQDWRSSKKLSIFLCFQQEKKKLREHRHANAFCVSSSANSSRVLWVNITWLKVTASRESCPSMADFASSTFSAFWSYPVCCDKMIKNTLLNCIRRTAWGGGARKRPSSPNWTCYVLSGLHGPQPAERAGHHHHPPPPPSTILLFCLSGIHDPRHRPVYLYCRMCVWGDHGIIKRGVPLEIRHHK